ncbi:MAG TPA: PspC domain-containing protein [Allosphingosinicella sp.]|jgi:phage shock protein C
MTRTFTLDKANGKLMGVCAGLADSTGFDVTLVRLLLVAVTLCLTGMTIPLYIAAGLIAPARG